MRRCVRGNCSSPEGNAGVDLEQVPNGPASVLFVRGTTGKSSKSVKRLDQKYFALPEFGFALFMSHPRPAEGRFRSSRYVGHGMRRAAAASGVLHRTETLQRT